MGKNLCDLSIRVRRKRLQRMELRETCLVAKLFKSKSRLG